MFKSKPKKHKQAGPSPSEAFLNRLVIHEIIIITFNQDRMTNLSDEQGP